MLIKLLCFLWGHRTTVYADEFPGVVTDAALFKDEELPYVLEPRTVRSMSFVLMPPHMKVSDAFFVGPVVRRWQRLSFCVRCGETVSKKAKAIAVGELVGND